VESALKHDAAPRSAGDGGNRACGVCAGRAGVGWVVEGGAGQRVHDGGL